MQVSTKAQGARGWRVRGLHPRLVWALKSMSLTSVLLCIEKPCTPNFTPRNSGAGPPHTIIYRYLLSPPQALPGLGELVARENPARQNRGKLPTLEREPSPRDATALLHSLLWPRCPICGPGQRPHILQATDSDRCAVVSSNVFRELIIQCSSVACTGVSGTLVGKMKAATLVRPPVPTIQSADGDHQCQARHERNPEDVQ